MMKHKISFALYLSIAFFAVSSVRAQTINPTPIAISLTPDATQPSPTLTPSPTSLIGDDRFEPNDSAENATRITFQTERDLTLIANDVDYFTVFVKAGQLVQVDTDPIHGLDTKLKLFWNGQLAVENDDRTAGELGSSASISTETDGWLIVLVEQTVAFDGHYDLTVSLREPTNTPTPTTTPTSTSTSTPTPTATALPRPTNTPFSTSAPPPQPSATATSRPTSTSQPTSTPTQTSLTAWPTATTTWVAPTATEIVWPTAMPTQPTAIPTTPRPISQSTMPVSAATERNSAVEPISTPTLTATSTLTAAVLVANTAQLTVRHIGRITPEPTAITTQIQLLIYYDSNNDRIPSPSEGVANISVLAVNTHGQRLAQIFTNRQGEASFAIDDDSVARIVVPFVPGWSERVRANGSNSGIVLGLPAVRLPIFFPVESSEANQ